MMSLFLDSNVFIEHFRGNPRANQLIETLFPGSYSLFINDVVYNEVLFMYLKHRTGKGYWGLKKHPELVKRAGNEFVDSILPLLAFPKFLDTTNEIIVEALTFVTTYGLLPSDALILATAKYYGLDGIVSLDSDLLQIAPKEGLLAVSKVEDLEGKE
ncbi:type II toxin-antitoxin system VapC family toxin [Thermococcus thermotolerans]|uniref:type II toxin-antitoxin system VapC family toxin n=1 Tax=Thermococcus thermotolerans TaxID=2969672 RepID=UPI002158579F|nr:type II toxin-antitoxin system VapC family toxin [Thermococcus thermotolerans]